MSEETLDNELTSNSSEEATDNESSNSHDEPNVYQNLIEQQKSQIVTLMESNNVLTEQINSLTEQITSLIKNGAQLSSVNDGINKDVGNANDLEKPTIKIGPLFEDDDLSLEALGKIVGNANG